MADIATTEPTIIRAGETLTWSKSLSDYSATEFTLKYYLTGPASLTLTAAAYNTTDHLVSVTATLTAAYTYGIYDWEAYAEKGLGATLEKYFISSGKVLIKTAAGKSFAKTMLDSIEAILEGRATSKDLDLVAKGLGGANISRDPDKLMRYRDKFLAEYQSEVSAEATGQGKASGKRTLVRFTRPS